MIFKKTYKNREFENLISNIKDLNISVSELTKDSEFTSEKINQIKSQVSIIENSIIDLDKKMTVQQTNLISSKKTLVAIGAIISLVLAFFTYYSEHITKEPKELAKLSAVVSELHKSVDLLWVKYNKNKEDQINQLRKEN